MLRNLLFPALALVAAMVLPNRKPRGEEYIGVNHPSGEMRLSLAPAGEFRLTLAVWDPIAGGVVASRELVGRWRRVRGTLELRSATRRLVYRGAQQDGPRWVWKHSNLPTFADGIPLVPARPAS